MFYRYQENNYKNKTSLAFNKFNYDLKNVLEEKKISFHRLSESYMPLTYLNKKKKGARKREEKKYALIIYSFSLIS